MIETLIEYQPDQIYELKERKLSEQAQSISDDFHDANTIDTNQFCGETEQFEIGKNYEFLNLISVDYFEDFDEVVQKQRLEKFLKKQKRRNRLKGKHEKQEKNAEQKNNKSDMDQQNNSISNSKTNQKNNENNNNKVHKKSKRKSPSVSRQLQSDQQFTHDLIEIIHQNTEVNKNNKQKLSEKMSEIYRETITELQNEKKNISNQKQKQEETKEQITKDQIADGFQQVEKKKYYLTKIDKTNWHIFHKNNQKQQQPQYSRNREQEQKTNYREFDEIAYNRKYLKEIKRQKDYQFDKQYKQSKNPKYFQKKKVIDYEAQFKKNTLEIAKQPIYQKFNSKQQRISKQQNEDTQQYVISKKKKDQSVQACLDLQSLENLADYKQIIPNSYIMHEDYNKKKNKDQHKTNRKSQTSSIQYGKYQDEIQNQQLSQLFEEKVLLNECDIFNYQTIAKELNLQENFSEKSLSSNLKIFIKQFSNDCETKQNKLIKLIFSQHLQDFFSVIDQLNSKLFVIRKIIFLRLQYVIKQLFLGINSAVTLTQYGSTTTSLNLPTSDLDLLIQGFGFITKFQTQQFLSNLFQILSNFTWIAEAKPIFTANVPILKLKIDPFVDFNLTRNFRQNFILHPFATYSNFNIRNKSSFPGTILNVDISMETLNENNQIPTSVGIQSTKLIQKWLDTYPHLQQLALILKSVLSKSNLNQTFYGGMSSYSLLILIIAFLKHKKIEKKQKLFQVLKQFCYFYAFEFQPECQGIRIDEEDQLNLDFIYNLPSKIEANKIIIYEPITKMPYFSSNIEINKIFSLFEKIYRKIEKIENQVRQYFNEKTVTLKKFLDVSKAISDNKDQADINLEAVKLDCLEEENFLEEFTDYEEQKKKLNR